MSVDRTFVDTNVLTYLFDDSEADKQAAARACLTRESRERELVVSTQVLQELYVSMTKGRAPIAPPELAEQAVRQAAEYMVVQVDAKLVLSAIETSRQHRLSFWDALIVRAAVEARCDRLLSEDLNHAQRVDTVRIVNPFGSE